MTVTIGVEVAGEDDAVVVKRAIGGLRPEALRREGERLRPRQPSRRRVRRAQRAGGGRLGAGDGPRWPAAVDAPGRRRWRRSPSIVAGAASTLADLHELGITHGRIDASHVLLGDNGRPRLCGFGDGRRAAAPEDDVAMLGALLAELLGRDDESEPIPERRWRRRGGGTGGSAARSCSSPTRRRLTSRAGGPPRGGWPRRSSRPCRRHRSAGRDRSLTGKSRSTRSNDFGLADPATDRAASKGRRRGAGDRRSRARRGGVPQPPFRTTIVT